MKLTKTKMSNRDKYALEFLKCDTLEDFRKLTPAEFLKTPNAGWVTMRDTVYSVALEALGDKWFKMLACEILERAKDMWGKQ